MPVPANPDLRAASDGPSRFNVFLRDDDRKEGVQFSRSTANPIGRQTKGPAVAHEPSEVVGFDDGITGGGVAMAGFPGGPASKADDDSADVIGIRSTRSTSPGGNAGHATRARLSTPGYGVGQPVDSQAAAAPVAAARAHSDGIEVQLAAAHAAALRKATPSATRRPPLAVPNGPEPVSPVARALFSQTSPRAAAEQAESAESASPPHLMRRLLRAAGRLIGREPAEEPQFGRFAVSPDGRFYVPGQGAIPDDGELLIRPSERDAEKRPFTSSDEAAKPRPRKKN